MRPKLVAAVCSSLVLVTTHSACASGRTVPDPAVGRVEVRDMLRSRASRLLAGDVAGYLHAVTGNALPLEEAIARGAAAVPLDSFDISFNPPRGTGVFGSGYKGVPVEYLYRYRGLAADNVFHFVLTSDIKKEDGNWVVTDAKLDPEAPLPPWATGPVAVSTSPHFLAIYRPGAQQVDQALRRAEESRDNLAPKLTLVPDANHLVLLARDHGEMEEFVGTQKPPGIVAVALYGSTDAGVGVPRNREMVIDMSITQCDCGVTEHGEPGDYRLVEVFQHELAHLALSRYATANQPSWVVEAAAMFLAGERRSGAWRAGVAGGQFDALSFDALNESQDMTGWAYTYADAAVLSLVEAGGADKWWDFYGSFIRRPEATPDAVFSQVYGFNQAELDVRTRAWLQRFANN